MPPPLETPPDGLVEILRALPERELNALVTRLGVRIDPAKRLDPPQQLARALVSLPELRDPARLPQPSIELLRRVAEAKGTLIVSAVPSALEPLSARGLMFARGDRTAVELVIPPAYLVQLRSWEGEDPRGLRALLAQASLETTSAIAAHYLGRPAPPPVALALEAAWEVLSDPRRLAQQITELVPTERRLLDAVEREGGEVDTEELLELEREPLRLRTASGATPSRRGVGVSLERRGLLIPVHPNRHVVPTEVAQVVGAARHEERARRRAQVKTFVLSGDHAPRRARFAADPSVLAMGLALAAREPGHEVRAAIGTPKSLVQKLAARFGREVSHVGLLTALSRAIGLWDASATSASAPPGAFQLSELAGALFSAWRRGGAWDEGRTDAEVLRLPPEARDSSPVGVVRAMVLEALLELADGSWVPWASFAEHLKSDDRLSGLTRLLRRWSERLGLDPVEPMDVARRIVAESLPALGVLDLGDEEPFGADSGEGAKNGMTLRLTARGRAFLQARPLSSESARSKFLDTHVLRIGSHARVAAVLSVAGFAEVGRASETLDLVVAPQTLARALSAGIEADALRQRIEALAPLPETLSRTLAQASVVLGRASFVPGAGFLWVEDGELRELLRSRRATAELFVDPSPQGGLLLQPGVNLERLSRRCRAVGVEILSAGQVVRARSSAAMPRVTPARGTSQEMSRPSTQSRS